MNTKKNSEKNNKNKEKLKTPDKSKQTKQYLENSKKN